MHPDLAYVLVSLACLATLLGGWLVVRFFQNRPSVMGHISGATAGYLVSVAIVRVIPEALHYGGDSMMLWVLGGFLFVHVIQHGITPHLHSGDEPRGHKGAFVAGIMALLGLSLHSFVDGMSITAAVHTHTALGILMFIGVFLHRVPEGATISSIFLVRGFKSRTALWAAGILALAALLGALCQNVFDIPVGPVLAIAAGLGIYVACADLLPQAQKESGRKSIASLVAGVLLFLATDHLLPHDHESHHTTVEERCSSGGHGEADHVRQGSQRSGLNPGAD